MTKGIITKVRTFIDWDTARRVLQTDTYNGRNSLGLRAMIEVQNFISEILVDYDKNGNYRIDYRIYHGWHRGKTKTDDYREFENMRINNSLNRRLGKCVFSPDFSFGNVLLCGGKRKPLYDTLRRRENSDKDEQKMVDTALVSDLLTSVRTDRDAIHLIIGDDDDLIPGIITAESWGAKVILGRVRRNFDNSFVDANDLIRRRKAA